MNETFVWILKLLRTHAVASRKLIGVLGANLGLRLVESHICRVLRKRAALAVEFVYINYQVNQAFQGL